MSDNDVEDVSFLPGESLHRKAIYEPSVPQRCKQFVCSQGKATIVAIVIGLFVLLITLIAAFARPSQPICESGHSKMEQHGTLVNIQTDDYVATNGKPFPWRNVRLPDSVLPIEYHIFLHPNISLSIFQGVVTILCKVQKETDFFVFHIKDLNISDYGVKLSNGENVVVNEYLEYKRNEQIYVRLERQLPTGTQFNLEVKFLGQLTGKLSGFYKSSYKTDNGEERYIATTHFEPTDARSAFPCFDEPHFKAIFQMSIVREKDYIALYNMPLNRSEVYEKGSLMVDHFEKSVDMSTYLVAFVVCDYKNVTSHTKGNVKVSVYTPPDQIERAHFALEAAVAILDYYDEFFGVKYPLPKADLIAIPDFAAGAMENWGLVTYRLTAILYDPVKSSASSQQWVAVVIAHELAHQWFGNLVTMKWWDDLWLNEGFASFVEYIGTDRIHTEWQMTEQFIGDDLLKALYLDSLSNSHPISVPVHRPSEINEIFDSITYSKGASIIRMLQEYIGKEKFQEGLKFYLKKFQYGNADNSELWQSFQQSLDPNTVLNVTLMMETWTKQMGYPVITLSRNGNKVTATQERFLLYPQSQENSQYISPFLYKWYVPFSYTTSLDINITQKLEMKLIDNVEFEIKGDAEWVKGNSHMFGYFRVNYDEKNWKAIIYQLNKDHTVFSAGERAGLIDDAFQLARSGRLSHKIAFDLTQYLVHEEEYVPWDSALSNLGYIEGRIQNKPVYRQYKNYMMKLMEHLLNKLTWDDSGDHLTKFLTAEIFGKAIQFGHQQSVDNGKLAFKKWSMNSSSISPNLKMSTFRAGIEYGDDTEWELCWDQYLKANVASEKTQLLAALGFTKDVRLLSRLLSFSLENDKFKSQDTPSVISIVSGNYGGQALAWRFLQQNWDTFYTRYGSLSFILSSIIKSVASGFDTDFDYLEVKKFFETRDAGTGVMAVKQAMEKIQMNSYWMKQNEKEVTDWLMKNGS
ncbi:hypothetical protein ACJMK2_026450 [Sinanodonta woodiana]|uniref:Aminopeptidase n=1 Tax=Sinanodonta woodiana TaxID=1069815 RepID=A0ABD3XNC1_SINWO